MSKRWTEQDLQRLQKERGFTIVDTKRTQPNVLSKYRSYQEQIEIDKNALRGAIEKSKRGRPKISDPEVVAGLLKENKFGAKKVTIDGITFDSTKEGNRYLDLKLMEKSGNIRCLELQPGYSFIHDGQLIGKYTADFRYIDHNGHRIVEDVKSDATRRKTDYRLRKKMMKIFFDIEILET